MEYSSEEETYFSISEFTEYTEKPYEDPKAIKYKVNVNDRLRSSQAVITPHPSPMRQQQSPPPAVLPSLLTTRSSLSEMAARAARILSSSGETQDQPTVTPPTIPAMAK
ncbi:hypothetical protein LWI29_033504 [Acer saccharum]|uniref:Uncharacterized protein n=1 Tax=Acer saccharum TaxID=4024 RepID=A0AA39VCE4_ACESA|nr:hypothetical protein LWI29_033504 [Acer saccharum]